MALKRYVVQFRAPSTVESVHGVRNFAEDLDRSLHNERLGTVPNMDEATTEVYVDIAATRHAGRVFTEIKPLLRHHQFDDALVLRE
jgi:hypothetical protein